MDDDKNAFAEQVNGMDEDGDNQSAVDPGYSDEQEAQATERDRDPQEEGYTDAVRKRIHAQAKKHQREMRQMQEQILHLQAQSPHAESANPALHPASNPYNSPGQPNPPAMSEEERIQKAVRYALGAKEHEEKQARVAEHQAHIHKKYQRLNDEFDKAAEKYDDFDEVVREGDAPFSEHVRDALLLVKNPAEVAYKLGKNRSELERISRLHPLDQAHEVIDLSHALRTGNDNKTNSSHSKSNPIGSVRANPNSSSSAITDKTPPSEIRRRMKAGTWK